MSGPSGGVRYYTDLLRSRERIRATCEAIRSVVREGDRVLEIGCGLGTFAFCAAEAGAAEVVAVDRHPVVHLAEAMAAANGLADRIRFVRGTVPDIPLDGPFDVVVFEDFPGLLLDPARHRLLEEMVRLSTGSATFVPDAARLVCVPVSSPELGARLVPELEETREFGLDPTLLRGFLRNEALRTTVHPSHHLGTPVRGGTLSFRAPPEPGEMAVEGRWCATGPAEVNALLLWFDLRVGGRWFSNGPDGEEQPWGQYAHPLDPPLPVRAGEEVVFRIGPEPTRTGAPGFWRWSASAGRERRSGHGVAAELLGPPELGLDTPSVEPDPEVGDT